MNVDGLNFEGCACPWCRMVVVLPIVYNDHSVIGTCPECNNMYKAIPHPKYSGGVLLLKHRMGDDLLCDAADESCIGDLTPDDIEHIVDITRRIKNAKNVREGRYGR